MHLRLRTICQTCSFITCDRVAYPRALHTKGCTLAPYKLLLELSQDLEEDLASRQAYANFPARGDKASDAGRESSAGDKAKALPGKTPSRTMQTVSFRKRTRTGPGKGMSALTAAHMAAVDTPDETPKTNPLGVALLQEVRLFNRLLLVMVRAVFPRPCLQNPYFVLFWGEVSEPSVVATLCLCLPLGVSHLIRYNLS